MQKIPTLPKQLKVMAWLKTLPVPLQIVLIVILLYLTWHFRYYTDGVDEAELIKVEGILYTFDCVPRLTGQDDIILYTSLRERGVWFGSWQKCNNLDSIMHLARDPQQAVFYTKTYQGVLSRDAEGALWIYAVDLVSPNKPLIYPARGLGVHYNPNPWCLAFFFIALALIEALRERWLDYKNKQHKQKARDRPRTGD
ncbi:hypothetical protein Q3O59_02295 [Alkalimonas delamerensis]|uniref:Uncharacterized protein n=1 Tax=Alkalimonas delamerensis TaxID=265981 RepID=A0ABT9GLL8_9GAMM|nr:hypothetical protein [Alkalimonas delamerensis]MDP4527863.1 hypothetical protein [Alkalimonas delamerensis]